MLLNLADDKLNADASTKVVEPVLSSDIEHASRERSYAKGIQGIEKLDKPSDTRSESRRTTPTASSSEDLSEADYKQVQSLGRAGVAARILSAAARCASWRRFPNIRRITTGPRR